MRGGVAFLLILVNFGLTQEQSQETVLQPDRILVAATARVYELHGRSYPQVYTLHGDGTSLRRLTNTPHRKYAPAISRNGKQIAFMEGSEYGRNDRLVVLDAEKGTVNGEVWVSGREEISLRWASDGTLILKTKYQTSQVDYRNGRLERCADSLRECPRPDFKSIYEHHCLSPRGNCRVGFWRDTSVDGTVRVKVEKEGRTGELQYSGEHVAPWTYLFEHKWSPDGRTLAMVWGDYGASSWWTATYLLNGETGEFSLLSDTAENLSWVGGNRFLLSIVGNKHLKEFNEADGTSRTIQVWANDLVLFDLERKTQKTLIKETSLTSGYDFLIR